MAGSTKPDYGLQNVNIAFQVLCPALALIVTTLRVYSRLNTKTFGWDDACIILAMVLALVMAVGSILCIKYLYIGVHYWDVPTTAAATFSQGLVWTYVVGAVYNPILAIVKQSVLIFLLRLASIKRGVRAVIWGVAIFNGALMVSVFLVVIFQCHPIAYNWDLTIKGTCIEQLAFGISTAVLTILTDIIAVALPFYIFLGLKLPGKTKAALIGVFLLGLIVTAVSAVRLYFLWQHSADIMQPDVNYSFGFTVSSIEVNLAIITASCPALWPLVRSWLPQMFTSRGRSTNGYQQNRGSDWTPSAAYHSTHVAKGGNSAIGLKSFKMDANNNKLTSDRDSDEEVLTGQGRGIQRVIQISVSREDELRRAGDSHSAVETSKGSSLHGSY